MHPEIRIYDALDNSRQPSGMAPDKHFDGLKGVECGCEGHLLILLDMLSHARSQCENAAIPVLRIRLKPVEPQLNGSAFRADIRDASGFACFNDLFQACTHMSLVGNQYVRQLVMDSSTVWIFTTKPSYRQVNAFAVFQNAAAEPAADTFHVPCAHGANGPILTPEEKPAENFA